MKKQEKEIVVNNLNGVHSRVATELAGIARRNKVMLNIMYGDQGADCSSVLDVLSLAIVHGSSFVVQAEGEQSGNALCEVEKLFSRSDI